MAIYIKLNNTEYPASVNGVGNDRTWDGRDTKTITLTMTHDEVAALLPDNAPWSIVQREMVDKLDNDGNPTGEAEEVVNEWDNSDYSLSGAITDHRDGTVSIKMGKPTESELSAATVTALVGQSITTKRAAKLRPIIEAAATSLSDVEAAKAVELFPKWKYPHDYVVGDRVNDISTNKLYKCVQAHTSQADWTPDAAASLWSVAADPAEEWPAWSQPVGAHDAYAKGAKVSHNGKHWTSSVDSNVWEPGTAGTENLWTESTE